MGNEMLFNYFYGTEADQFTFYRIPKLLIADAYFENVSSDAKILYGLMLDRMSLSAKNGWLDKEKRVFIYFSLEDTMESLHIGRNKALKTIAELDAESGVGLIERVKQGQGKPARIYVKNFVREGASSESQKFKYQTSGTGKEDRETDPEVYNLNFKKFTNQTSRGLQSKLPEVYKSNPNNNKYNNNNMSDTESNLIISDTMGCDSMSYIQLVRENLEIDTLIERNPENADLLEEICELVTETMLCENDSIVVASNRYPANFVKSKLMKLNAMHVEYVVSCMRSNTTKVNNIKKYMLAALFNAPSTMQSYYRAEVNHDFPQFAS